MPLFWFHESQGLPLVIWSGKRAGMQGSRGTLSRRFSASMLHVPWGEGDFSTPLRFRRNDGNGGSVFVIRPPYEMTVCCSPTPSSRAGLRVGMGQVENALMIL